jgi:hypothetical protein
MGMSLLSFFELFEVLIEVIMIAIKTTNISKKPVAFKNEKMKLEEIQQDQL